MIRILNGTMLLLLCLAGIGEKAEAQALSLNEARERACRHNKQIAIADENSFKAQHTLRAMKTNYLPKLSGSAYAYYTTKRKKELSLGSIETGPLLAGLQIPSGQQQLLAPLLAIIPAQVPLPSIPLELDLNNSYVAGIAIEQPIYMGGKIIAGERMARIGVEMARLNRLLGEDEVILAVDEAYWTLVQTLEMQTTAEAYSRTIDEVYRVVNNAMNAGMRTEVDLMRVKVEQSQAKLQLQRAANGVKLARMNLCQVIGAPLTEPLTPTESFPIEPTITATAGDPTERPEYGLLSRQIEMKQAEVKLIRSDFLPHIGLRAAYTYTHGIRLNEQLLLDNGGPSVMVSVSLPIFRWGEGRAKIRAAQADQRIATLKQAEIAEKIVLEQQQAENRYYEMAAEVELTRITVEETEQLLRQSHNRYQAGLDTTASLLEAETIAVKAKGEHIAAKAKLALAHTALLKAMGRL